MLVLSRRIGESVVIGHDVVVTVLEVRGDVVRVGIDAPRHVQVHRQEIYLEIEAANRSAASPSVNDIASLAASLRRDRAQRETGPAVGGSGADTDAGATPPSGGSETPQS